jgi:hypothetical protein
MIGADVNRAIALLRGAQDSAFVPTQIDEGSDLPVPIARHQNRRPPDSGRHEIVAAAKLGFQRQKIPAAREDGVHLGIEDRRIREDGGIDLEHPIGRAIVDMGPNAIMSVRKSRHAEPPVRS